MKGQAAVAPGHPQRGAQSRLSDTVCGVVYRTAAGATDASFLCLRRTTPRVRSSRTTAWPKRSPWRSQPARYFCPKSGSSTHYHATLCQFPAGRVPWNGCSASGCPHLLPHPRRRLEAEAGPRLWRPQGRFPHPSPLAVGADALSHPDKTIDFQALLCVVYGSRSVA